MSRVSRGTSLTVTLVEASDLRPGDLLLEVPGWTERVLDVSYSDRTVRLRTVVVGDIDSTHEVREDALYWRITSEGGEGL